MKQFPAASKPSRAEASAAPEHPATAPLTHLTIYTDGASRGNPGEAGAGVIMYNSRGEVIKKIKTYLGVTTNNVAEYMALIIALKEALTLKVDALHLYSDSELMVRQIKGIYKVKDKKMQVLSGRVQKLLSHFSHYDILSIDRRENREADILANLAIDEKD